MFTSLRSALLLSLGLVVALALVESASAAPPNVVLGNLKTNGLILPGATVKKKVNHPVIVPGALKPVKIPGALPLIPGPGNIKPNPQPGGGGGGGNGGGNGGGGNPPANPPANPEWVDILNGIGGLLNPGHGPGHHPGHHPGHYPGHHPGYGPGYIPGYPTPTPGYVPSNPLPETPMDPALAIIVTNPEKNGAAISFVAGGQTFTVAPGFQQVVRQAGSVEVRFDRGGALGTARYSLHSGVYQFLVTDEGWNLFRKVYRVTLDNRENPFPFRYLVGNTVEEVPANGTREYEEDAPLVLTFDPGTGEPATRTLDTGNYRIAINPDSQLWDLQQAEAATPDAAASLPPSSPVPMGM